MGTNKQPRIINIGHRDQVIAAKEYASTKPSCDLQLNFNAFMDGVQWLMHQIDGAELEGTDGRKIFITNGRLIGVDLSQVEYGSKDKTHG